MSGLPAPAPMSRAWLWFLVGGGFAVAGYYVLLALTSSSLAKDTADMVFPIAAVAALAVGVAWHKPSHRGAWYLLIAGESANLLGDLVGLIQRNVFHSDPYPSAADVGYLLAYPLVAAGLVALVRRRTPGSHTPAVIDAAVLSVSLGLLWWLYLVRPLTSANGSALELAVSVAYPAMDMLLLAIALRLTLGVGARTFAFVLLVGSLTMLLLTDVVYAIFTTDQLYGNDDNWMEWGWQVAYLLIGAAALHPSMRWLDRRAAEALRGASRRRIAVLTAASLLPLLLLIVQYLVRGDLNVPTIAVAGAVLFLLMLARLGGLAGVERRLAIHDGLTGVYSRQFLEEAFRIEVARAHTGRVEMSVVLLDLDNFRLVNEVYGAMGGDLVLAEVATRLHQGVRPGDVIGRDEGDRFVVLLPAADARDAAVVAERLRQVVSAERVAVGDDTAVRVTASLGLATMPRDGLSPQALFQAADQGLYVAKRAGRNRTYTRHGPVNVEVFHAPHQAGRHALT